MFFKFDYIRNYFLVIIFLFTVFLILKINFPQEAFAMDPYLTTDYYGNQVYVGSNTYAHFHPTTSPDIDTIQSIISKPYRPLIKEDWYDPQPSPSIQKLDGKSLYELDSKPIYKSFNPPYDRDELHFWTPGQSFRGDKPVIYHFEPKHTTFELDADSYQGSIFTNVYTITWHRRNKSDMEIIRDYCTYLDNMSKKDILSKISLCVKTTSDNITFLYLKCNQIGKRKILWTIWERNRNRYNSYKEFKISWDSNSSIWSTIKKDIREDIRVEVEDLLGIRKIKKDIRKSVRSEVEKLLRESRPFSK
jgi:hypothetical protein